MRVQVTLELKAADLAASHFAVSPLFETIEALRTLREPGRHALHLPWVRWAENELARSRLDLPRVWPLLIEPYRQPEFLMPAPHSRLPDLGEELEALVATRPSDVRTSLARTFPADPPEAARALAAHPRRELRRIAEEIELSFSRLLEPHWQRIRSLLDADIVHRARTLTDGGAAAMLEQLHTGIRWRGDSIVLADAAGVEGDPATVEVHPGGLVLEPSVFIWPDLYVKRRTATRTTIRYPARGVGALWDPGPHSAPGTLADLLGERRAQLLLVLRAPHTTTELARRLGVTPSAISQHLAPLRAAGLIGTEQLGRQRLHVTSALGAALLGAERAA